MQIQEKNEDSEAVTQKFLRLLRNNKKKCETITDDDTSNPEDEEVNDNCEDARRQWQPSAKFVKAVEENETTTDTDRLVIPVVVTEMLCQG